MGDFGQGHAEVVLPGLLWIQGPLYFFASAILAEAFLFLKKKQFVKFQLYKISLLV